MGEAFRERAIADRRGELIKDFPMRALEASFGGWHSALAIYENWFEFLKGRKADRARRAADAARLARLAAGSRAAQCRFACDGPLIRLPLTQPRPALPVGAGICRGTRHLRFVGDWGG